MSAPVQIPLWSMNTYAAGDGYRKSDRVQIPLWSMNTRFARKVTCANLLFRFLYGRWIRFAIAKMPPPSFSSDSSMVDEYGAIERGRPEDTMFRFLYGRWIRWYSRIYWSIPARSDSSMVDEYQEVMMYLTSVLRFRFLYGRWILVVKKFFEMFFRFRFLYGRWIRSKNTTHAAITKKFRFLYGRWILVISYRAVPIELSSDSSMVDEYRNKVW